MQQAGSRMQKNGRMRQGGFHQEAPKQPGQDEYGRQRGQVAATAWHRQ
jgi:hypothetical protein